MAANVRDQRREEGAWDVIKTVLQALLLAFLVRTFLFQPFNIPSGSMYPTLMIGDYLFVSKLSYGYSKYSFNFSIDRLGVKFGPVPIDGRVFFAEQPERGDVVVFKLPADNETDYIKRLIGLPGDRIQVIDGILKINGTPVQRERIADYVDPNGEGSGMAVPRYRETLPNGVTYETLDAVNGSAGDNTKEYVVPPGHYFMMGDNRDNSEDSRFLTPVGYVPYENLVGRADLIFFSHNGTAGILEIWKWPLAIRWDRFFKMVD
ncbi:MAG TPA: signal peptidase I [Aestuariivirgaceae bacterium]|jgi:signal peptidase I